MWIRADRCGPGGPRGPRPPLVDQERSGPPWTTLRHFLDGVDQVDHRDHNPSWWTMSVQDHLGPLSDIFLMLMASLPRCMTPSPQSSPLLGSSCPGALVFSFHMSYRSYSSLHTRVFAASLCACTGGNTLPLLLQMAWTTVRIRRKHFNCPQLISPFPCLPLKAA